MDATNLPFNFFQMVYMAKLVLNAQELLDSQMRPWDPEETPNGKPQDEAVRRMFRDIYRCKPPVPEGCYIAQPEDDISKVHAIIVGPKDTPYEGGFFHFLIRFPPDYPNSPPRVKLMTTDNGNVRFNPNLYKNGKVCLSMLGTWPGPCWGTAQSLHTVLGTIRGVMHKEPYKNEPGMAYVEEESEKYNEIIYHETLRVAVCGMLDRPNPKLPESLKDQIKKLFLENYSFYMKRVQDKVHLDGKEMMIHDRLQTGGSFSYGAIRGRLEAIHRQLPHPEHH